MFLDIVLFNNVYYNDGNSNNWLKVCLTGTASNINGIGARIEVSSPSFNNASSKKAQIRDVRSAQGFGFMSTLNTHFGLGSDTTIDTVTIYWPSGTIDVVVNPNVNETLIVTEGETLSLQTTIATDLILYPNPTKGEFVLTIAAGASCELIKNGVNGFLIHELSVNELVKYISRLADSAQLRREFSAGQRAKIPDIRLKNGVDRWLEVCREIL